MMVQESSYSVSWQNPGDVQGTGFDNGIRFFANGVYQVIFTRPFNVIIHLIIGQEETWNKV